MYELKDKEMIFVFTGPDGSGRKTVADMTGSTIGINKVISCTTRQPHPSEEEGQDYYFMSREQFLEIQSNGGFLESVEIDGNLYGIRNKDVERLFTKGCVYLILNRYGADILKKHYGDKVTRLFIYADRDTVLKRQQDKGYAQHVIDRHIAHYDEDMDYQKECEHAFENYELAHTVFDVTQVLESYLQRDVLEKD